MDPNAILRLLEGYATDPQSSYYFEEAAEAAKDLRDWIARGGFEPAWNAYPAGTALYHEVQR